MGSVGAILDETYLEMMIETKGMKEERANDGDSEHGMVTLEPLVLDDWLSMEDLLMFFERRRVGTVCHVCSHAVIEKTAFCCSLFGYEAWWVEKRSDGEYGSSVEGEGVQKGGNVGKDVRQTPRWESAICR